MTEASSQTIIWPTFRYDDAPAAVVFLVAAFGFEVVASHPGEDGKSIAHAELRWPGGGGIMLGSTRDDDLGGMRRGNGATYIVTDDLQARFERAVSAGASVVRELRTENYGGTGFSVADPEGVIWSFGDYPGEHGAG